jgi:peptidoglycan/LPS O-acetylase OafA/YrhL
MMSQILPPISATKGHIQGLNGLRCLSIMIVIIGHFFLGEYSGISSLGVYIFFVISGFLITRLLLAEAKETGDVKIGAFYYRRFLRLFPVLIVYMLAVAVFAQMYAIPTPLIEIASVFLYFVNYLKSYYELAGTQHILPIGVLWSLSVEEHFYLIAPLFIVFVRASPGKVLAFSIAMIVLPLAIRIGYVIAWPEWSNTNRIYMASETRFDSIAYGVFLAALCELRPEGRLRRAISSPHALVAGVALLALSTVIRDDFFRDTLRYSMRSLGALLIVAPLVFSPRLGWLQDMANSPPADWIGRLSYSLYIWHGAAWFFLSNVGMTKTVLTSFAELGVTFILAVASYYLIEMPVLRWRNRISSRRKGAVGESATA